MAWYRCGLSGSGGSSIVTFICTASHPTNPSTFTVTVMANGSTVFTKGYSCTVYGVFAETTDTFTFLVKTYTVKAQGFRANSSSEKMLDFSIDEENESVLCPASNSSYSVTKTFYLYV